MHKLYFVVALCIVQCFVVDASIFHSRSIGCAPDTIPPVLSCPPTLTVSNDLNQCGATILVPVAASDNCGSVTVSPALTAFYPVGTSTVLFTGRDLAGNQATCTATIIVNDVQPAVLQCITVIPPISATGPAGAIVTFPLPTVLDNCPVVGYTVTAVPASGSTFPLGITTVVATAVDPHGISSSCSFQVNIVDDVPPFIVSAPSRITTNAITGFCYGTPTWSIVWGDNCGTPTVTDAPPKLSQFPVGTTFVTSTARDASGNINTYSFAVDVFDTQPPTPICPAGMSLNNIPGVCFAIATFTVGVVDNCPGSNVFSTPASGAQFNVGSTTVVGQASDARGLNAQCTFVVSVVDNEPPRLICPTQINANTDLNACVASGVTFTVPAADNCPGVRSSSTPASGSTFPLGSTTVTSNALDTSGGSSSCSFIVRVTDRQAPSVTCPSGPITVNAVPNTCGASVTFTTSARDNCAGVTSTLNYPSGHTFLTGTTTVVFTATDTSGNSATCTFDVIVRDTQPPVINCPPVVRAGNGVGACNGPVAFVVTADDPCGVQSIVSNPASGTIFGLGSTTVHSVATDYFGNTASCQFDVIVEDTENPVVSCPNDMVVPAAAGTCKAVVTYSPSATDNCGLATSNVNPQSGFQFDVGRQAVVYTATDIHDLFTVCDWTVTVLDTQPPTITCPSDFTVFPAKAGDCSATVDFAGRLNAGDNCAVSSIVSVPASGTVFPVGVTTVQSTAIDSAGLTAVCTFRITVSDLTGICQCGNNILDPNEQCDSEKLGSATCISQGYPDGGTLFCNPQCRFDYSRCASCGDGRIEGTEVCDGSNLNGETCQSKGFPSGGTLSCSSRCRFDTSQCNTCGDGIIQAPEQCDGANLNGKTCQLVSGTSGVLQCNPQCQFDTTGCVNPPKVVEPATGQVVAHMTFGITVKATGFVNDRKVTVTLNDGRNKKVYNGLTLSGGDFNAVLQAPSPLAPSRNWTVAVRGETTQSVAVSAVFTVQAL